MVSRSAIESTFPSDLTPEDIQALTEYPVMKIGLSLLYSVHNFCVPPHFHATWCSEGA